MCQLYSLEKNLYMGTLLDYAFVPREYEQKRCNRIFIVTGLAERSLVPKKSVLSSNSCAGKTARRIRIHVFEQSLWAPRLYETYAFSSRLFPSAELILINEILSRTQN